MLINIIRSGASAQDVFIMVVAILGAVVLAMTVHEFAHAFIAYRNGDPTAKFAGRMSLNPLVHIQPAGFLMLLFVGVGWAKPVPVNPMNYRSYKKGMISVSLAGVTANLIMAVLSFGCIGLVSLIPANAVMSSTVVEVIYKLLFYFFMYSTLINVALIAFNLLPIYPLDGFRVVETLAPNSKYVQTMYKFGVWGLFIFILGSYILGLIFGNFFTWGHYLDVFGTYIGVIYDGVLRLITLAFF